MKGLIVKGIGGFYYVKTANGIFQAKGRGLFKKEGLTLSVGDQVDMEILDDGDGIINTVYPRRNHFIRPPIANIDCFVVVFSATKPKPNFSVIDKFLITGEMNDMESVICVNKCDLVSDEELESIEKIYGGVYPVIFTSGKTGKGIDSLLRFMSGKKVAFAGPSGVGKSTITNLIIPEAKMETGAVSDKTSRGKHTTRHVEIFEAAEGGMVFDTPGFTSFEIPEIEEDQLRHFYPEIERMEGKCRFDNCRHISEPSCSVTEAVKQGRISSERYKSYLSNMEEIKKRKKY